MNRLDRWLTSPERWGLAWDRDGIVAERLGCPNPACGERDEDRLAIAEFDSDVVHCDTCGVWYRLPEPEVTR